MSYKDSDYTIVIALICWLESMHFCAETHLDDGDFSVFVFPSTTIARVPHLNILWKYSSQEGSQRFSLATLPWLPSCTDTCQTHPGGEGVNTAIIFCLLLAAIAHLIRTEWSSCALNWTRCRIDAYILWAAFEQGLHEYSLPRYPQSQSVRLATRSVVATLTKQIKQMNKKWCLCHGSCGASENWRCGMVWEEG